MYKIRSFFDFLFRRKAIIKALKPSFVFWYIEFNGDQRKIAQAMKDNYGLANTEHYNSVMKDVNLDDYLLTIEKDFLNYIVVDKETYVIKKSDYLRYE